MTLLRTADGRGPGDLVPVRRRPARLPQHRRARPRRRAVGGGPLRRRGHPRRSRAPTATTASPRGGPTSARRSRTTPSSSTGGASPATAARSCGCGTRTPGRLDVHGCGDVASVDRGARRLPVARPAGPAPPLASGWTAPRAASTSSTRSTAAATTSGWPSTSAPRSQAELDGAGAILRWPGAIHARRGAAANCRRSCGGACTGGRPTRSSAGTPAAWGGASPPSRCSASGRSAPGVPLDHAAGVRQRQRGG